MIMDTEKFLKRKKKREKEERKNDHHIWLVEERFQSGPEDPEWRPTGDNDTEYRIYGFKYAAIKWMKCDYSDADPKNLRVRKYVRVNT